MLTLNDRINKSFSSRGLIPAPELTQYINACDHFTNDELPVDELQNELCNYLDTSALRVRSVSDALGRVKEPPMSEIVTEAINMLVDSIVRRHEFSHLNLSISSEKNVKLPNGGYRKPDIGVWCAQQLKLVVECKTSLGRKRNEWLQDYETRVKEFSSIGLPSASLLLFVGTDQTWKGFSKEDPRVRKSWFSLCQNGSWFGGGKTGETLLILKQHPNVIADFKTAVTSILLS